MVSKRDGNRSENSLDPGRARSILQRKTRKVWIQAIEIFQPFLLGVHTLETWKAHISESCPHSSDLHTSALVFWRRLGWSWSPPWVTWPSPPSLFHHLFQTQVSRTPSPFQFCLGLMHHSATLLCQALYNNIPRNISQLCPVWFRETFFPLLQTKRPFTNFNAFQPTASFASLPSSY